MSAYCKVKGGRVVWDKEREQKKVKLHFKKTKTKPGVVLSDIMVLQTNSAPLNRKCRAYISTFIKRVLVFNNLTGWWPLKGTQLLLPQSSGLQFEVHPLPDDKYEEGHLPYSFKPPIPNEIPALYVPENSAWYPASHQGWDSSERIVIKKSVTA